MDPSNQASASESDSASQQDVWTPLSFTFCATIFLSAFLLFQVQPLISKIILPWFGGSPAVWTTCMLVFQLLLFGGYTYAHVVSKWIPPRIQQIIHLVLLVVATLVPVVPPASWKPEDSSQPVLRIMLLLLGTVGLPYFMLSTTGPLVQAWFSRAFPGASPYRLYSLSNIGSLLALITFPFVFEPYLELGYLAIIWRLAFAIFALLCSTCALNTPEAPVAGIEEKMTEEKSEDQPEPNWWRRTLWVALPAWASMMLLAVTNHVCQDIAVIPFLWIVPLSLYLLTFIICFDHPSWYLRIPLCIATAVFLFAASGQYELKSLLNDTLGTSIKIPFWLQLSLFFTAMFLVCLVCHGELVKLRPDPSHLTEYYLLISAGGAIGGLFVSLVAPEVFDTFYEWNLGWAGSFVLVIGLLLGSILLEDRISVPQVGWGLAALLLGICGYGSWKIWEWEADTSVMLYADRSFYGCVSVGERAKDDPERHNFSFYSGSIRHGRQFANAEKRRRPTAYYTRVSGVGKALAFFEKKPGIKVGTVGLGVGTIAAYSEAGQTYRFYEINPQVEHIADKYFTYLSDARKRGVTVEVVSGDARLALEREEKQGYHVLVLDAFSGDSIPTHLLTDEAMKEYKRHLHDDGILAIHITNHYIDLAPVVLGLAKKYGLKAVRYEKKEVYEDDFRQRTDYLLLTNNEEFLAANPSEIDNPDMIPAPLEVPLWTDSYSNVFLLFKK